MGGEVMRNVVTFLLLAVLCVPVLAQPARRDYSEMKSLVAVFSATGTTLTAARMVAEVSGGTLYVIEPQVPYTAADLDWRDTNSRCWREGHDLSVRPAIAHAVDSMEQYEVVYIGFPIWWGRAPAIINTFLESYDMQNKIIVPFFTSNSSGAGMTIDYLKPSAPQARFKEPHLLSWVDYKAVKEWLQRIF